MNGMASTPPLRRATVGCKTAIDASCLLARTSCDVMLCGEMSEWRTELLVVREFGHLRDDEQEHQQWEVVERRGGDVDLDQRIIDATRLGEASQLDDQRVVLLVGIRHRVGIQVVRTNVVQQCIVHDAERVVQGLGVDLARKLDSYTQTTNNQR